MKKKSSLNLLLSLSASLWSGSSLAQDVPVIPPSDTEIAMSANMSVQLRALDKITARISEISLTIGSEKAFGTLIIKARYCRSRPPQETPESFAYLEIDDVKVGGKRERIFEGWMLASSPAVSALEHPVYDIWTIGCSAVSPELSVPKT